jgi:transcriptional regulator with XRE-family HTH domain
MCKIKIFSRGKRGCIVEKTIGTLMKEIRNTKKITQQKLADASNVSRSYLNDVENNRYKPSIEFLQSISTGLSNGNKDEYYTYFLNFIDALGYIDYNYIEKLIIEKHSLYVKIEK